MNLEKYLKIFQFNYNYCFNYFLDVTFINGYQEIELNLI